LIHLAQTDSSASRPFRVSIPSQNQTGSCTP
jgi:hypothetical protein